VNTTDANFRRTFQVNFHVLAKTKKFGDPARIKTVFGDSKISTATATTFKNFKNFSSPNSVQTPFFLNFTHEKNLRASSRPAILMDERRDDGEEGDGGYIPPSRGTEIPDEATIREEYEFKLPVIISKQENDHVTGHYLEAIDGPVKLTEGLIRMLQNMIKKFIGLEDELRGQIKVCRDNHEAQIDGYLGRYMPLILAYIRKMKDDFVEQQNENFKLQKEIALYKRELSMYEEKIAAEKERVRKLESKIFGTEVYDLQTDVQYLEEITKYNLRESSRGAVIPKPIIH
jgi:hypothetical protein